MKQYRFCPYVQNISIIKNFLARPLTLIIGIFFAATAIFNFAVGIFPQNNSINLNFDAISIMLSIAFFLLYFSARSKSPEVSFRAPVTLIKVVSIINIVLAEIALSSLTLFILITLIMPASPVINLLRVISLPLIITVPVILVQLFFYIFFLVFAGSIKKSTSSIYLCKKGAGAFGVTAIILIVFSIAMYVASLILLPMFIAQYNEALESFASFVRSADAQYYFSYYIANSDISSSYTDIMHIISFGINLISYLLLAIFAFSYKSYINKFIKNINVTDNNFKSQDRFVPHFAESPVSPEEPIKNNTPFLADAVFNDTPAMAPPIPPQSNTNNPQITFDPNTISFFDEKQNPYTQPPLLEQSLICPNCGSWCNPRDLHCGACGHKLK